MKKITFACMATALTAACLFAAACGGTGDGNGTGDGATEYVVNDAADLLQEDFGIAVKKGDAEMKAAVDAVITQWNNNGTMQKYFDYYNDLADESKTPAAPEGLKLTWDLSAYTDTLDMYTESGFPPYEFVATESAYTVSDGNEADGVYAIAGVDVAIACQVAENLHCKLVIHDVLFDTIITHLNAAGGKALAAAGMSITDERKEAVDFSEIYSSSTISIVCAKDAGYTTLKSLEGLTIGVQEGTSGHLIADDAITGGYVYEVENEDGDMKTVTISLNSSTEVVPYKTYAAALAALQAGKIDAILMDKVPALLLVQNA